MTSKTSRSGRPSVAADRAHVEAHVVERELHAAHDRRGEGFAAVLREAGQVGREDRGADERVGVVGLGWSLLEPAADVGEAGYLETPRRLFGPREDPR